MVPLALLDSINSKNVMTKALAFTIFFIIAGKLFLPEVRAQGIAAIDGRDEDLVFIQGKGLQSGLGWSIRALRVGAIRDGVPLIIPAQIDERDPEGNWVYTQGHEASEDIDKGLLDANDELVFMAADCGGKGDAWDLWPRAVSIDLITVTDPLGSEQCYAYLLRYARAQEAAPISGEVDYIHFDPETDTAEGIRYIVGFTRASKISYRTYVIKQGAGGSGKDILDRFKIRLQLSALWGSINVTIDESDMIDRMTGWVDGPVRVLRKAEHSLRLLLGLGTLKVVGQSSFFPTYFEFLSQMTFPFELDSVLTEANFIATTDFNNNAIGMTFWSDTNQQGVRVDGIWSEEEKRLDLGPFDWIVLSGPQGAWMNRLTYLNDIPFSKNLYYRDDAEGDYGPEDEPGAIGDSGFNLGEIHKARKGVYRYITHIYAPIGYRPGDEAKYLNMVDNPLQSSVTPIPRLPGSEVRKPDSQ